MRPAGGVKRSPVDPSVPDRRRQERLSAGPGDPSGRGRPHYLAILSNFTYELYKERAFKESFGETTRRHDRRRRRGTGDRRGRRGLNRRLLSAASGRVGGGKGCRSLGGDVTLEMPSELFTRSKSKRKLKRKSNRARKWRSLRRVRSVNLDAATADALQPPTLAQFTLGLAAAHDFATCLSRNIMHNNSEADPGILKGGLGWGCHCEYFIRDLGVWTNYIKESKNRGCTSMIYYGVYLSRYSTLLGPGTCGFQI